jgi:Ca2+ transporting ATPase
MFKHILGQAVFQFIVLMVLIFAGDQFIPEYEDKLDTTTFAGHPEWKWKDGIVGGTVRSGRMRYINGDKDYSTAYD